MLRLTRNDDKQRGFVNGATCVVIESLLGNSVFICRLVGTGNYVLVHPREEDGCRFLPCVYGYATTIRRAQGADLDHGCLYFDHTRPAARGYGYVGASRFKTRDGCYIFGKVRQTDFLPVGDGADAEVLLRGYYSVDSDDEDGPGIENAFAHRYGNDEDQGPDAWSTASDDVAGNDLLDFAPCASEGVVDSDVSMQDACSDASDDLSGVPVEAGASHMEAQASGFPSDSLGSDFL